MEGGAYGHQCNANTTGRMSAPRPLRLLCVLVFYAVSSCAASVHDAQPASPVDKELKMGDKKLELFDGVYVSIPVGNTTGRVLSFEVDTSSGAEEGRGKKKKMLQRILPMFLLPFIIQSAIIPLFLGLLKFMLMKSLLIGKLALALILLNAFKNNNSFKGRDAEVANVHYGYQGNGMEEYASYLNH